MNPFVSTLVIALLALAGSRISFSTERVPAATRLLFRAGTHFLFLGMLLGPLVLDVLTPDAVALLYPLLGLGLGWIGLLFGLQLERETLKKFPATFPSFAMAQALVTFFVVAGLGMAGLYLARFSSESASFVVLAAAATAAVSAPAGIALVSTNFLVRGQVRRLLFFTASIDGLAGILLLHLIYAWFHGTGVLPTFGPGGALFWAGAGLALGVVFGVVFIWLTRLRPEREELILYLMGISALSAGAALQLQLSPLFVGVIMGALVANLSPERARIFRELQRWEQPIYIVLLIIAGAFIRLPTPWIGALVALYTALRMLGKVAGTAVAARGLALDFRLPGASGLGLVPQGGISIAMALSLQVSLGGLGLQVSGHDAGELLFATIVLGVVASDLVGPLLTTRILRRAGEIRHEVEAAIAAGDEDAARIAAVRPTQDHLNRLP
jgi:Kef-type K+ transport system membrane component KefB